MSSAQVKNPQAGVIPQSPQNNSNVQRAELNPSARDFAPIGDSQAVTYGSTIPPPIPVPHPPRMQVSGSHQTIVPFHVPNYCPVVYPTRLGRPGTVYYVGWNEVPASAIPVPVRDGNGGIQTHFFNDVREYY